MLKLARYCHECVHMCSSISEHVVQTGHAKRLTKRIEHAWPLPFTLTADLCLLSSQAHLHQTVQKHFVIG